MTTQGRKSKTVVILCLHDLLFLLSIPSHTPLALPSQLSDVAAEGELYKYVAQSFKAFEQAFQQKAYQQSARDVETLGEAEGHGESDRNRRPASAFLPGEISEAMGTVFGDRNLLVFEPLEEAVDR